MSVIKGATLYQNVNFAVSAKSHSTAKIATRISGVERKGIKSDITIENFDATIPGIGQVDAHEPSG